MRNLSPSGRISAMLFMAALVLVLCPLSNAQQEPTKKARPNSLQKGAWSLQFELDNDFRPRTFEGSILNIKRHYSERTAVRLGVSITVNVGDQETVTNSASANQLDEQHFYDVDFNHSSYDLMLQYLYYPVRRSEVHLFLGLGPHLGFTHNKEDAVVRDRVRLISTRREFRSRSSSWTLGGMGVIGVEWFLWHNVSFLAEYGILLDYQWENWKDNERIYPDGRMTAQTRDRHSFNVRGRPVKFGMSVYF
ncbi:MAG: hypothetical protein NT002_14370 [candidate division Zixibacteria bacterium]|nr:hypothetical protein [candidate division Zixibacteria bacterium]